MEVRDIEILADAYSRLPERDQSFAQSLVRQFKEKGDLSEKQWYWVNKLTDVITGEKPQLEQHEVGDFSGLKAMFDTAGSKLKWPRISINIDGMWLRLQKPGPTSKYPDSIVVKLHGTYIGRIEQATFTVHPRITKEMPHIVPDVTKRLLMMSVDPAGIAGQHGHKEGSCCFCDLPLTDPKSVQVGYGKTCAKNYGLVWGGKQQ